MKNSGRILVIDDQKIVCESCRRVLEREGYEVSTTTEGQEGLAKAQTETFDAVIVDIRMPHISGFEVLSGIRKHKPEVAVVMITAYPSAGVAAESQRLGARGYLTKPFTPEEFCLKVHEAVLQGEGGMLTSSSTPESETEVSEPTPMTAPAQILIVGAGEHADALQEIARSEGCSAETTCNADEVLQRVGTGETEILVFGLDAFRRHAAGLIPAVRKIRGDIPIIVVPETLSQEMTQNVRRDGGLFYLVEPFGPDEVRAVIRGAARKVPFFKKAIPRS